MRNRVQATSAAVASLALFAGCASRPHVDSEPSRLNGTAVEDVEQEITLPHSLREVNFSAEDYVSMGGEFYRQGTREGNERAILLFGRAIERDPGYVPGFVGLSEAYRLRATDFDFPRTWIDAAASVAAKATHLDPESAAAHRALGMAYYQKRWYPLPLQHFERAFELEPSFTHAFLISLMHSEMGRLDQELMWLQRACAFDSTSVLLHGEFGYTHRVLGNSREAEYWLRRALEQDRGSSYLNNNLVLLLLAESRLDDALRHSVETLALDSMDASFLATVGQAYWYLDDLEAAERYLRRSVELEPEVYIGSWQRYATTALGEIYQKAGRHREAAEMFARSMAGYQVRLNEAAEGWGYMYDLAGVYAVRGEKEEAYRWLERAIDFGWNDYHIARHDPLFATLRDDTRFRSLMSRVNSRLESMNPSASHPGEQPQNGGC